MTVFPNSIQRRAFISSRAPGSLSEKNSCGLARTKPSTGCLFTFKKAPVSRLFFIPLFRHNGFLSGSEGEIAAWVLLRFCGSIETNENGMIKMCVEIPRGHLFHISIPHSPIFFSLFLFHSSFSFIFFFPHRTFTRSPSCIAEQTLDNLIFHLRQLRLSLYLLPSRETKLNHFRLPLIIFRKK